MAVTNPVTNTTDRARDISKRRKRKKIQMQPNGISISNSISKTDNNNNNNNNKSITPWKSEAQQQIYSSKLLQALRHVRQTSGNKKRDVREAADRILAVTAKGRTRWSRAILKNKLKIKFMKSNRRQRGLVANNRSKKPRVSILRLKTKNLPAVQRKSRVLGGLVPGCRKQPLPVVLEETIDYIPALEMQVKAMAALVELLSGGSSSGSGSSTGTGTSTGILSQLGFNRPPPSL